ncbi:MAG TPA: VapC toxin family PIN domain ribonuclease [Dokdonella sp.]
MIGLDSNALGRYIMQNDAAQAARASRVVEALSADEPALITRVSLVERAWVLDVCYKLERAQLVTALEAVLRTQELLVERAEQVWQAVRMFRDGAGDFANCLIERCSAAAGCTRMLISIPPAPAARPMHPAFRANPIDFTTC